MDFATYRPLTLRTAKMRPTALGNLKHSMLGLMTELGEFATEVKRIAIYNRAPTADMRSHMIEEIGDAQWYIPLGLLALDARQEFLLNDPHPSLQLEKVVSLEDCSIALGAMAGALMGSVTQWSIDERELEATDKQQMVELYFIMVWVIDNKICPLLEIDPDAVRQINIDKLRQRFPDAYTDEAAEARADKGGLPATLS